MLLANIASSFAVSAEAKALYPFLANPVGASDGQIGAFLDSVYAAAAATALLHAVTADPQTELTGIRNAEGLVAAHA